MFWKKDQAKMWHAKSYEEKFEIIAAMIVSHIRGMMAFEKRRKFSTQDVREIPDKIVTYFSKDGSMDTLITTMDTHYTLPKNKKADPKEVGRIVLGDFFWDMEQQDIIYYELLEEAS